MSPEVQNRDIRGPTKRTYVLQLVLKIEAGEKELPRNSPSILFWIHHWQSRCQLSEFKTDQWNPTVLIFNFALWKVGCYVRTLAALKLLDREVSIILPHRIWKLYFWGVPKTLSLSHGFMSNGFILKMCGGWTVFCSKWSVFCCRTTFDQFIGWHVIIIYWQETSWNLHICHVWTCHVTGLQHLPWFWILCPKYLTL